jgi:hypothetical protein
MKRSERINLKIEVAYPNSDIMKNQIIKDNKKKVEFIFGQIF